LSYVPRKEQQLGKEWSSSFPQRQQQTDMVTA